MKLSHLRVFIALAEELHFGRAANRMGLTQPRISLVLKDLEADLDTTLIDRNTRDIKLTRAGDAFLVGARATLMSAERARIAAKSGSSDGVLSLKVGLMIGASQPEVGALIARFKAANPLAQITLTPLDERDLAEALSIGKLDVAIAWDASIPKGLYRRKLASVPMCILVPDNHPWASRKQIDLSDLRGVPVIIPARDRQPVIYEMYRKLMAGFGFEPTLALDVGSTIDAYAMVSGGAGIGHAPTPVGFSYPGVQVLDQEPAMDLTYEVVWAHRNEANAALLSVMS